MSESLFPTRWANDKAPSLEKFTADFPDDYVCAEYLAAEATAPGGLRLGRGSGNAKASLSMTPGRGRPPGADTRPR